MAANYLSLEKGSIPLPNADSLNHRNRLCSRVAESSRPRFYLETCPAVEFSDQTEYFDRDAIYRRWLVEHRGNFQHLLGMHVDGIHGSAFGRFQLPRVLTDGHLGGIVPGGLVIESCAQAFATLCYASQGIRWRDKVPILAGTTYIAGGIAFPEETYDVLVTVNQPAAATSDGVTGIVRLFRGTHFFGLVIIEGHGMLRKKLFEKIEQGQQH